MGTPNSVLHVVSVRTKNTATNLITVAWECLGIIYFKLNKGLIRNVATTLARAWEQWYLYLPRNMLTIYASVTFPPAPTVKDANTYYTCQVVMGRFNNKN